MANSAKFFRSLTDIRKGHSVSKDVVREAEEHCNGGPLVRSPTELWSWIQKVNPYVPIFRNKLERAEYPAALAAFVVSSRWKEWEKHSVWVLHGELFISRLGVAKGSMSDEQYRDNYAGALMHRANGLTHMARCANTERLKEISLPCWEKSWTLISISAQAVKDLRQSCTLRSEKYGKKSDDPKSSAFHSYQATLRNLADALEIHAVLTGDDPGPTGAAWLRSRAANLALKDARILAACNKGEELTASDRKSVDRDLRLAETATSNLVCPPDLPVKRPSDRDHEAEDMNLCLKCKKEKPTYIGFSCRCRCVCANCVKTAGSRILECPGCGEFTEFVQAN
jgi:hypothetical protein